MRDPVGPRADFLFRRPTSLPRKGKLAPGKIQGAYAELYFLDHVETDEKYLVLTDPEFYEKFREDSRGKLNRLKLPF